MRSPKDKIDPKNGSAVKHHTPFNTLLSTIPTLSPLELNAVAMKMPNVPPQTMTSNVPSDIPASSELLYKPATLVATC